MKAAVMYPNGGFPQYTDFKEPVPHDEDGILVTVKAVALKHLDRARAARAHYSSEAPQENGRVVGGDGICLLPDGTRVYAMGESGVLAEKAVVDKRRIVKLPDALDDVTAAALPNAVIGSAMALRFKAAIQPGEVVLVNGATGFTGRVAVQIARHYGAKKIIVTGRNERSLKELLVLGADETISILQDNEQFKADFDAIHAATPIDVVIDYLWGPTAEMILACLKGNGSFTHRTRYVSVGAMSGDLLQLSAANLRSVQLELSGSGLGAWSREQVGQFFSEIMPEMFQLAAEGKLSVKTTAVKLENIADLWNQVVPEGGRLVVLV